MIAILCTLLMIAVVIIGVIKKFNVIAVMFSVSIISLIIWTLVTGQSAMGEETIGSNFLDVFVYVVSVVKTQLAGTTLTILSILGYVGFMNRIKASDSFTVTIASPLMRIKKPYLLLSVMIVVIAFLKLVVPSAISLTSLLVAILYPILRKTGCTRPSIASAFLLGTCITWGPADVGVALTVALTGTEVSVTDFFLNYQFIPCIATLLVVAILYVFVSKYFDKKETIEEVEENLDMKTAEELKNLGVPKFYAILPLLPLVFILLFSGKILPYTLEPPAIIIICISIALILHLIVNIKTFKASLDDLSAFFAEMGKFLGSMGFLVIGGATFAGVIGKVGGMQLLVELLNGMGGGVILLTALGAVVAFAVVACTGSYTANLNIFVPFFTSVAQVTGFDPLALAQVANSACGLGTGLTPVSGTMLFLTGHCKVSFPTVLKRNIIPLVGGLITMVVITFILH